MGVVSVTIRAHRHLVVYPLVPVTTHRTAPSLCCCTYFLFFRKVQRFSIVQNLTTNYSSLLKSVSGQFLDSAQSQRHNLHSTRRKANNCPFLVLLVDYFFTFSTPATASGVQDASCRLSPRPRRSRRGKATPTHPQASPCSPRSNRPRQSPRLRHCRSAGSLSAMP